MLDFITKRTKKTKAEKDGAPAGVKPDASKEAAPGAALQETAQSPVSGHHHPGHGHDHHQDAGDSSQPLANPVLNAEDEAFLQSILDADDAPPPPLPPRVNHDWSSDTDDASAAASLNEPQAKDAAIQRSETATAPEGAKKDKKPNRLSLLFTRHKKPEDGLKPEGVSPVEGEKEKKDLGRVLDRLNLSAKNNTVVSMSSDTSEALQRFTQVFKDLVNGVPTAYDDLTKLFEDRDGALNKGFEKLPTSLQKLVTQLPEKLTGSIAPELLAAAAESQGLKAEDNNGFSPKTAAEKMLLTKKIMELVTKPGAIVSMLRAIVETLKVRWPAFIGMNVIWSVALTCKWWSYLCVELC
jgi:hypothetical protein